MVTSRIGWATTENSTNFLEVYFKPGNGWANPYKIGQTRKSLNRLCWMNRSKSWGAMGDFLTSLGLCISWRMLRSMRVLKLPFRKCRTWSPLSLVMVLPLQGISLVLLVETSQAVDISSSYWTITTGLVHIPRAPNINNTFSTRKRHSYAKRTCTTASPKELKK